MRLILLLLLFTSAIPSRAWNVKDTIDPENFKAIIIEKTLFDKINAFREENGVKPLIFNQIVHKAAYDHSAYLRARDTLTHEQDVPGKRTVQDRVRHYLRTRRLSTGENIARIELLKPTLNYTADGKTEAAENHTYEQAVNALFNAWKQSSTHKKNMLNERYVITAISVAYDASTKRLTAVQVFAHVG